MERFTISLSDTLAAEFDRWLQARGYSNRSEGVRDLLRKEIETERISLNQAEYSVATLSFIFNHHERKLADRLISLKHSAHDLIICSSQVHLDHENCMECLYLRGPTRLLQSLANSLAAEPGVRHSSINLIPVQLCQHEHSRLKDGHFHTHPYS